MNNKNEVLEEFKKFWQKYEIVTESDIGGLLEADKRSKLIDKYLHPDDFRYLFGVDNKKLEAILEMLQKEGNRPRKLSEVFSDCPKLDEEAKQLLFHAIWKVYLPFRNNKNFGLASVIRGDIEKAKVILLLNNPGIDDVKTNLKSQKKMYFYAIENTTKLASYITWNSYDKDDWYSKAIYGNTNYIIQSNSGITAEDICIVEFFPYPTKDFRILRDFFIKTECKYLLPSQKKTVKLVKELTRDPKKVFICRKNAIEIYKNILDDKIIESRFYHFSSDYVRLKYDNIAKYTDVKTDIEELIKNKK